MKKTFVFFFAAALSVCLLMLTGCPKKTEVASSPEGQGQQAQATENQKETAAAAETNKATEATAAAQQEEASKEKAAASAEGLKAVYFDYDQATLRSDAREALKSDAAWMKAHPQAKIRIEGNCDDRGTVEYNQALGQRRAAIARKYLATLGVSSSRISLISFGKEKPVCTNDSESCWQKNRRDEMDVASQ